jgi:predicted nucleic acid-binding Zn ribbon protein
MQRSMHTHGQPIPGQVNEQTCLDNSGGCHHHCCKETQVMRRHRVALILAMALVLVVMSAWAGVEERKKTHGGIPIRSGLVLVLHAL